MPSGSFISTGGAFGDRWINLTQAIPVLLGEIGSCIGYKLISGNSPIAAMVYIEFSGTNTFESITGFVVSPVGYTLIL